MTQREPNMSINDKVKDLPVFKHFTDKEKKQLAHIGMSILNFEKGELIIKEGDPSTTLYMLVEGSCLITKTRDGTNIRLSKLQAGELFGEMAWISQKPRQSNVVANEKSTVLKMDDTFFSNINPEMSNKIKDFLIELLIHRLDHMNEAIMKISKLMRS